MITALWIACIALSRLSNAAIIKGFDLNAPVVPSGADDLVVEQVWGFDAADLPNMMVHMQWVPGTDQVITAHKSGMVRLYASIDSLEDEFDVLVDIRAEVNSDSDHGLLSFHLHPDFAGANGVKKMFIMYTGNPVDVTLLPNNDVVAPLRPVEWGMTATGGYEWPFDLCTNLEENNYEGKVCEKKYYVDRYAVDFDAAIPTAVKEITLFDGVCGSSTTHGPGTLLEIDGDLVFSMGDGSQYEFFDPGFADVDACYEPAMGLDQGVFRAQRDEFPNGKVMRIPNALLDSEVPLTLDDLVFVSKGNRQAFRMYYQESADRLYIGDVGFGDGGTTERIFVAEDVSLMKALDGPFNWGWPCIEGLYSSVDGLLAGEYNPYDTPSEQERAAYLLENGLATCDAIKLSVEAFVAGEVAPVGADDRWRAPLFEYRVGILDPDYPDYCTLDVNAAITSVFVYEGDSLPELYQGKLMFSDHIKKCLWYFDNDADGNPDTTIPPHVLIANSGFVDIQISPDGLLYAIDYLNARVIRMYTFGAGPDSDLVTDPPTLAPTSAPISIPEDIIDAQSCFDPMNMPELAWVRNEDGSYQGDLVFGAVILETAAGVTRTRGYNGMIPGPLIRMKACGVYHLNVYNDLADWPQGFSGEDETNGIHDPTITNMHLHGLHISGEAPGDNVFDVVEAGEVGEYVYTIPCDHSGGTNWYHPHHHGSGALQTNAGAAGMLIIESSAREASGMPLAIQSMPEQFMIIQEFDPVATMQYAVLSGDKLFDSTALAAFTLVNGCDAATAEMTLEAGQWTRLRILNVGLTFNSLIELSTVAAKDEECELGLMGKDGVWVAEVPRALTENKMFVSLSSRLDVAIRCPEAGVEHTLTYTHLLDAAAPETPMIITTITVIASERDPADALPIWVPCRPAYLTDVADLLPAEFTDPFALEVRGALNNLLYTDKDDYIETMELGMGQVWSVSVTELHPLHVHVNHMQLGQVTALNQFDEINDWFVEGDWIDTLSAPGVVPIYVRPERFTGHMVLHCHIVQHSDNGVLGIINIAGEGDPGDGTPEITDFGTCNAEIPASTPLGGVAAAVPGLIEAEAFDEGGEGLGYHNINIARNIPPSLRADEAVEIDTLGVVSWVGFIRDGEWLQYTVNVAAEDVYTLSISMSAEVAPPAGLQFSVWLDMANECPPANQADGKLVVVNDMEYQGTKSFEVFEPYVVADTIQLPAGQHTLMFCFEGADSGFNFDSFSIDL